MLVIKVVMMVKIIPSIDVPGYDLPLILEVSKMAWKEHTHLSVVYSGFVSRPNCNLPSWCFSGRELHQ